MLTVLEISAKLGMRPRTIQRYCRSGIVGRKIGRDWLLSDADVEKLRALAGRPAGNPNWIEAGNAKAEKPRKK